MDDTQQLARAMMELTTVVTAIGQAVVTLAYHQGHHDLVTELTEQVNQSKTRMDLWDMEDWGAS